MKQPAKLSYKNESKIKTFPDKQKLRESVASRPIFQETLKEVLQSKIKWWGFPGGAVIKNLPANAGDIGLSPGAERSHMLRSN